MKKTKIMVGLIMLSMILATFPFGSLFTTVKADTLPPVQWSQMYGGSREDKAYGVIQTSDGGYIMTGLKGMGDNDDDMWVVKTDIDGTLQWDKNFGGTYSQEGHSIIQTSDGGYASLGYKVYSIGNANPDVYLVKTDSSGNQVWAKSYGGTGGDYGYSVFQTSDNGYVLAGSTDSYGAGDLDFYLIKTDSLGNQVWSKTYGTSTQDSCLKATNCSDGGFALAGKTMARGNTDFWLVRTDASGNELWNQTFGGSKSDCCNGLAQTPDGGFALVGYTTSFGAGISDIWVVKTDASGNLLWSKTFGGASEDIGYSIINTNDGNLALSSVVNLNMTAQVVGYSIIKMDFYGRQISNVTNGPGYPIYIPYSTIQDSDGNYLMSGAATINTSKIKLDYWLSKVDDAFLNVYTIDATVGANGLINPSGLVNVTYGGNQTFTITANPGKEIVDVLVDGVSQGAVSSYIFVNVTTAHAITATFALNTGPETAIVARGADNDIWYRVYDGSNWADWANIVGSTTIEPASAIFQGNLYIAAIDGSTHIWLSTVDLNTQAWSGWSMWPNTYASSVTFAASDDYLAIVARGTDNSIWYRVYDGSNWTDWTNLIGSTAIEPAVAIFQNKLYIAAIDGSTHIWLSNIDMNSHAWSGWNMWQGTFASSVTFASSDDKLAIVARGLDNSIWYRVSDVSNWNDWTNLIGSTTIEPAVTIFQGQLYIAAIDGSTQIWLSTVNLNTQEWSGWTMWPNTYASSITFAS